METVRVYKVSHVTHNSAEVVVKEYELVGDERVQVGKEKGICYNNNQHDREIMERVLPHAVITEILDAWGEEQNPNPEGDYIEPEQ